MPTLFELSDEALALESLLYESGGELPDEETERIIDNWLNEARDNRNAKLDSYASLIRELDARGQARKAEAMRLKQRSDADLRLVEKLKDRLLLFFERLGFKTVETGRFRLTRAQNGGKAPLIITIDAVNLPAELRHELTTYTANRDAIRAALESGTPVEGAEIGECGFHMLIK